MGLVEVTLVGRMHHERGSVHVRVRLLAGGSGPAGPAERGGPGSTAARVPHSGIREGELVEVR